MIRDLSQTLAALLSQPDLPGELRAALVSFEHPIDTFNPTQPTLNLFLYELKENRELRSNEPIVRRQNGSALIRRPPVRVDCYYLLTAWPGDQTGSEGALRGHRLLGQALAALARHATIPADVLVGQLRGQQPPLPILAAQPDGPANPAEFWSALGSRLRPAITVCATVAMELFEAEPATLVRTRVLRFPPGEEFMTLDGRVVDESGNGLFDARVELVGTEVRAVTDELGRYRLERVPRAAFTLRVRASGFAVQDEPIVVPDQPPPFAITLHRP
jgi:Pvc16 N-terminal domain/Carboxypeptidase regulatory-like domain